MKRKERDKEMGMNVRRWSNWAWLCQAKDDGRERERRKERRCIDISIGDEREENGEFVREDANFSHVPIHADTCHRCTI